MRKALFIISFLFCLGLNSQTITTLDALKGFWTAEGFGRGATGARNLPVYKFNSLADSGTGSLRQAIADASSGGYLLAEVAGNITLLSSLTIPANVYFAGQTAFRNGGQGITIRQNESGDFALINGIGNNSILRFVRLRRGAGVTNEVNGDDITITSGNTIMIDHVSMSWSTDEIFNSWGSGVTDITIQNSIISEALQFSTHEYTTDPTSSGYYSGHSKSTIIGNSADRHSFYRVLWAHNDQRNPLIGGSPAPATDFEIKNCIVYNSGTFGMHFGASNGLFEVNITDSRLIRGPNTSANRYQLVGNDDAAHKFYVNNIIDDLHRTSSGDDQWDIMGCESCGTYMQSPLPTDYQVLTPFPYPLNDAPTATIAELETTILADMGASLYEDAVDIRIKDDVTNGTGSIIDDPSDVGGYPTLSDMSSVPTDTDDDGIPDAFESEHGISDISAVKTNWYFASDDHYVTNIAGYTNIEIYLMYLTGELMEGSVAVSTNPILRKRGKVSRSDKGILRVVKP